LPLRRQDPALRTELLLLYDLNDGVGLRGIVDINDLGGGYHDGIDLPVGGIGAECAIRIHHSK
jgi:hypothetical protein